MLRATIFEHTKHQRLWWADLMKHLYASKHEYACNTYEISIQSTFTKGPSKKHVSTFEGGGVSEMLTVADLGGGGLFEMLTSACILQNHEKWH